MNRFPPKTFLGVKYSPKIAIPQKSEMSVLKKIGKESEKTAVKTVFAGALAGIGSYFILKRNDAVSLFGFEQPEYVVDALLVGLESATGDVLGGYILPMAEKAVIGNENLEKLEVDNFSMTHSAAGKFECGTTV